MNYFEIRFTGARCIVIEEFCLFSPCHDIAVILLKLEFNTIRSINQSILFFQHCLHEDNDVLQVVVLVWCCPLSVDK